MSGLDNSICVVRQGAAAAASPGDGGTPGAPQVGREVDGGSRARRHRQGESDHARQEARLRRGEPCQIERSRLGAPRRHRSRSPASPRLRQCLPPVDPIVATRMEYGAVAGPQDRHRSRDGASGGRRCPYAAVSGRQDSSASGGTETREEPGWIALGSSGAVVFILQWFESSNCGGGERTRTADFHVANVALYQLSYTPGA